MYRRGLAIVSYNRAENLKVAIQAAMDTTSDMDKIVVCDDGSTDNTVEIVSKFPNVIYVRGKNLGVAANKNRALYSLQDCAFICILEDDLIPTMNGWFQNYEQAVLVTDIHHFCRVQDKEVESLVPAFDASLKSRGVTPIYGESPRGDFTFISNEVIKKVGAFNPKFIGVGYAHGEWSHRVVKADLIKHPNKWIDIKELRDSFYQLGDTVGGRWNDDKKVIKEQIKRNRAIYKNLKASDYIYHPLVLS